MIAFFHSLKVKERTPRLLRPPTKGLLTMLHLHQGLDFKGNRSSRCKVTPIYFFLILSLSLSFSEHEIGNTRKEKRQERYPLTPWEWKKNERKTKCKEKKIKRKKKQEANGPKRSSAIFDPLDLESGSRPFIWTNLVELHLNKSEAHYQSYWPFSYWEEIVWRF